MVVLQTDRGWFDRSGLIGDPTQSDYRAPLQVNGFRTYECSWS